MKPISLLRSLAAALLALLLLPSQSNASQLELQILVIGNNQPLPSGMQPSHSTPPLLHFADDDAASMYDLLAPIADGAHLLTVMDAETQVQFPHLAAIARPPTVEGVKTAIARMAERMEQAHARGDATAALVFFSGHGSALGDGSEQQLILQDGGITRLFLYQEILERLPADYVHLIVDACHAEDVVRPRDSDASVVDVSDVEANRLLARPMLAHFPHVGTIVAASSRSQTHEWDLIRHGVFTYELLSALRGAADVNRDGQIEYSEVAAFLSAANRSIRDPRVRLDVIAVPPPLDRRVSIVDLTRLDKAGTFRVTEIPGGAGLVEVVDRNGRHIASTRGELGYSADLIVPAAERIYVRSGGKEARIAPVPGRGVSFAALTFESLRDRERGALADAIHDGLFTTEFGRGYYAGFVDHAPDLIAVSFEAPRPAAPSPVETALTSAGETRPSSSWNATLLIAGGVSTPIARDFTTVEGIRVGVRPRDAGGIALSLDYLRAGGAGYSESAVTASAGWLVAFGRGAARAWLGGMAAAGSVFQASAGNSVRWSSIAGAGPVVSGSVALSHGWSLWAEGHLCARGFLQNASVAFSLAPSAWLGIVIGI